MYRVAWALQSLWAASWLSDVEGLDRRSLVTQLLVMAIALSIGALLLGVVADSLRRHGKNIETLLAIIASVFIAAELALIVDPPFLSLPSWIIVAVVGSAIALSYAIIGDYFPTELIARANGVLNVLHFGWAFLVQYGTGLILEQWPAKDGHYPQSRIRRRSASMLCCSWPPWSGSSSLGSRSWIGNLRSPSSANRRAKAGQFTS